MNSTKKEKVLLSVFIKSRFSTNLTDLKKAYMFFMIKDRTEI